jgi:hypothetical protein
MVQARLDLGPSEEELAMAATLWDTLADTDRLNEDRKSVKASD